MNEIASAEVKLIRKTAGPYLRNKYGQVSKLLEDGNYVRKDDGTIVCDGIPIDASMFTIQWTSKEEDAGIMQVAGAGYACKFVMGYFG
jgi:hypothetical protein